MEFTNFWNYILRGGCHVQVQKHKDKGLPLISNNVDNVERYGLSGGRGGIRN